MSDFSIGDAYGSGFRLVARHPWFAFVWGVIYLLLTYLPMLLLIPALGPALTHPAAFGPGGNLAQAMQMEGGVMTVQPLIWVGSMLARVVMTAAIFRAVMQPQDVGFAYLRLGQKELWLGLLFLAMVALVIVGTILVLIPTFVLLAVAGFAIGQGGAGGAGALVVIPVMLAIIVLAIWLSLRFSLAAPMTFAAGEFRLFESWALTKGRAWKLLGLAVLLVLTLLGVSIVVFGLLAAVVFGVMGGNFSPGALAGGWRPSAGLLGLLSIGGIVGFLVVSFFTGAVSAIFSAPWAVVYQELAGPSTEAIAATFDA